MIAPFQQSAGAQGVIALVSLVRRRAKAHAEQQQLDSLAARVGQLRAERKCTDAELDRAAARHFAGTLAIAQRGA